MPQVEMIVYGRVQGVGFRYFVKQCADRHGIRGFVKNLADGSVRIIACANESLMQDFYQEIKAGNRMAAVKDISRTELITDTEYEDFFIV